MSNKQALVNEIETLPDDFIDEVLRYVIFIKRDRIEQEIEAAFDLASGKFLTGQNIGSDRAILKAREERLAGTAKFISADEFLANMDRAIAEGSKNARA